MAMKIGYIMVYDLEIFQSTRPVRGGTSRAGLQCRTIKNFNPPAPCGAGR